MGKIICEVCGTSYSETSEQCPICGCTRPSDAENYAAETDNMPMQTQYQYVKGGRFSKSNVKKRSRKAQEMPSQDVAVSAPKKSKEKNDSNKGLVIVVLAGIGVTSSWNCSHTEVRITSAVFNSMPVQLILIF